MKTKVVYSLISSERDNYLEQAYLSLLSLREHTKDVKICLLVDEGTKQTGSAFRKCMMESFDEVIVVDVDQNYTNAEKSRYLKTTSRLHLNGPCLFVDTDTIFLEDISIIDSYLDNDFDIAAVLDSHCSFKEMGRWKMQVKRSKKVGWDDIIDDEVHYNSGVILVKDTEYARNFYREWYNNWEYERKFGIHYDQIALAKTCRENGFPIFELEGFWNCQIFTDGIKFLSSAKIIHYFAVDQTSPYLFKNKYVYDEIKKKEGIPDYLTQYIKDGRSAFVGHCTLCGNDEQKYYWSDMRKFYHKHPAIFAAMEAIVSPYLKWRKQISEKTKK
jgi:lipopolysaccharide biosynthesis glycosyltransferase